MISRKSVLVAACVALLTAPMFATAAEARHKGHHRNHIHRLAHRHSTGNFLRMTFEGEIVGRAGWRFRNTGWDNSCFNLPYLNSQFACSSN
jgi:hypothetical protein